MSEQLLTAQTPLRTSSNEVYVAVFDFNSKEFISKPVEYPALFLDQQPLNERGLPGVTCEDQAVHVGSRNDINLPPLSVVGNTFLSDQDARIYAVFARGRVEDDPSLTRYSLDEAFTTAKTIEKEADPESDEHLNARLLLSCLAIKQVKCAVYGQNSLKTL